MRARTLRLTSRISLAVAALAAILISGLALTKFHENDLRDRASIADRESLRRQIRAGEAQRAAIKADQERLARSMAEFLEQSRRRHDETQEMIRGLKPERSEPR